MPYNYGYYYIPKYYKRVKPEAPSPPVDEDTMINNFQVGCDPEFIMIDANGDRVNANEHFGLTGEIGYDHGGRVAEFRPEPSKGVLPLMKKIQALVKKTPTYKLRAGGLCNGDSLGGHVHFGFDCFSQKPGFQFDANGELVVHHNYVMSEKGKQVVKALDAVTKVLEHLDILPKRESEARRKHRHGYGRFGDVRDSNGHMEYRSMASWLYDPKVAYICILAAKLAAADPVGAYEALKDCTSFDGLKKWIDSYKSKDVNAARASERLLEKGLKHIQVDPSVDFRGRWEDLGV